MKSPELSRFKGVHSSTAQDNPMNPHGLLIAYAENTVKPADASRGRRILDEPSSFKFASGKARDGIASLQ